ncbi:MAG: hypothetical protein CMC44_03655 [Flavobacteriaceae bacterium]|jgi:hypothetical protein|nr:hypothetical protein [Flavobacteriaceae bacterium]|tara:strand:- start:12805 stop:13203 length:399 start_codon:yes stop_codon:yes gene_type:complete
MLYTKKIKIIFTAFFAVLLIGCSEPRSAQIDKILSTLGPEDFEFFSFSQIRCELMIASEELNVDEWQVYLYLYFDIDWDKQKEIGIPVNKEIIRYVKEGNVGGRADLDNILFLEGEVIDNIYNRYDIECVDS